MHDFLLQKPTTFFPLLLVTQYSLDAYITHQTNPTLFFTQFTENSLHTIYSVWWFYLVYWAAMCVCLCVRWLFFGRLSHSNGNVCNEAGKRLSKRFPFVLQQQQQAVCTHNIFLLRIFLSLLSFFGLLNIQTQKRCNITTLQQSLFYVHLQNDTRNKKIVFRGKKTHASVHACFMAGKFVVLLLLVF